MKKVICVLLAAATLALCACGTTEASGKAPDAVPEQTSTPTQAPAPEPTISPKPDKNGFDEATNTEYVLGGVSFKIPSYYDEPESDDGRETLNIQEGVSEVGGIIFADADIGETLPEETFRENEKEIVDTLAEQLNVKVEEVADITLCDIPAVRAELDEDKFLGCVIIFPNSGGKSISVIIAAFSRDADYDYMLDFERILNSVSMAEEAASDGVTPEFKAKMDSYEEFFNEYVEFMQSYMNSDDISGMLTIG